MTNNNQPVLPLPCFVCGVDFDRIPGGPDNMPDGGNIFTATGNYGSTVFDPMTNDCSLEINICADCLQKHRERTIMVRTEITRIRIVEPWTGQSE